MLKEEMSFKKVRDDFARKNKQAMLMIFNADMDYVAARCCILNGLYSGFIIASEAIEKSLKALIYLEKSKPENIHNPYELKNALLEINRDKYRFLNNFDVLLKKLFDHYLSRYPDNLSIYGTNGASTEELIEIDLLWLELKDALPIPAEVKYSTKFFSELFCESILSNGTFWLKERNQTLLKNNKRLKMEYMEYKVAIKRVYK